jgi:hypothetical protein
VLLNVLSGQPSTPQDEKIDNLFDIAKPSANDYPALKRTLQFLKFSGQSACAQARKRLSFTPFVGADNRRAEPPLRSFCHDSYRRAT